MRNAKNVFHLAIPCADLEAMYDFYVLGLGCQLARRYQDRITLNFFGDQIVCHKDPDKIDLNPQIYPRHAGVTFYYEDDYKNLLNRAKEKQLEFFKKPFTRFSNKPEEHQTFFLIDPSNNLLEFKYYHDSEMMY